MSSPVILPHPVYPLPSWEDSLEAPDQVKAYLLKRNELIELERADPWTYGYRPEVWKLVEEEIADGQREILITGGNRASKSEYAGRKTVEILESGEKKRVWCLQTNEGNSIEMQQPIVWRYIPVQYKGLKKGQVVNISYTQKNGFSENKFILPNGSECVFRNYAQYLQDNTAFEGGDVDAVWCDELVPLNLVETLRYRLVTRTGLLLITFTPIEGYSAIVKEFMDGARTVQWQFAELLGEKVPRLQRCVRKGSSIVYFHSADNPFGGYDTMKKTLAGAPKSEIRTRAYGIPTKAIGARFPKFRESVHVIDQAKIPKEGSRYQFVDPASARNWFMIWVLVDARDRHYIYREWPCEGVYIPGVGDPGAWAEADGRKADGRAGQAQGSYGWGLERYASEIERVETESGDKKEREEIVCRWMDSRFGNTPNLKSDAATTMIEECALLDLPFAPAPLDPIEEGVSLINSLLDFDSDSGKEPKLYISSECRAVIFGLKVWTGKDEKLGASKDPVDCVRWMAIAGLSDVGKSLQLMDPIGADPL
jgi:hypothetical protein